MFGVRMPAYLSSLRSYAAQPLLPNDAVGMKGLAAHTGDLVGRSSVRIRPGLSALLVDLMSDMLRLLLLCVPYLRV